MRRRRSMKRITPSKLSVYKLAEDDVWPCWNQSFVTASERVLDWLMTVTCRRVSTSLILISNVSSRDDDDDDDDADVAASVVGTVVSPLAVVVASEVDVLTTVKRCSLDKLRSRRSVPSMTSMSLRFQPMRRRCLRGTFTCSSTSSLSLRTHSSSVTCSSNLLPKYSM